MIPKAFSPFLGLSDKFTEQDFYALVELYLDVAKELTSKLPQSRELSLALTKLEESLYFAQLTMMESPVAVNAEGHN